ncbi:MAG: haloacid dehalogenase [Paracoccus denitrificans]|nr:MAG: haloacid dehalogenase [Paracoccus denitrificans]PZO82719.1 MAG: haloacid dehalogenase [Paracoccus denitrificans]
MLIATDLDGTLVPNDTVALPSFTASVLHRLDTAGVPVVFVTARPLRWMDAFWPHVGNHGMAIVSNGAITYDAHERRIVSLAGISWEVGFEVCDAIAGELPGAQFAIECADGIRLDPHYVEPYPAPGAPRGPLKEIWTDPAVKLLVRHPDIDAELLQSQVASIVGGAATVTWSVSGLVEISAAGITKASALQSLCASLDVSSEDVIAFGDMPNDIPMLTWAGTSYAVANAHETVQSVAQRGAPSCADEGVAQVLERLLETTASLSSE